MLSPDIGLNCYLFETASIKSCQGLESQGIFYFNVHEVKYFSPSNKAVTFHITNLFSHIKLAHLHVMEFSQILFSKKKH